LLPGRFEGAALGFCVLLGCAAVSPVLRQPAVPQRAIVLALLGAGLYGLGLTVSPEPEHALS
jgi:hypothetical protein